MQKLSYSALVLGSIFLGLALTSCGPQEYKKQQYAVEAKAIGFRYLPAKVDILAVVDNSPSANNAAQKLNQTLNSFTQSLTSKFLDYHLAKTSILGGARVTEVLVHPDYNKDTLPDGTATNATGIVPPGAAINSASQFSFAVGTGSNGADYTYNTVINTLLDAQNDTYTNFLRDDAMLAVIVITNGAEATVDPYANAQLNYNNLSNYANSIKQFKGGSDRLVRFYPVVAFKNANGSGSDYCLSPGTTSYRGDSYFQMLTQGYMKGLSADFCNESALYSVLNNITENLNSIRQSYVYSRIVLPEAPIESTIQLAKTRADGSRIGIAKGGPDGWRYVGYQSNVPTVTGYYDEATKQVVPFAKGLNRMSGYVIELSGNGRMIGNETPDLIYEKQ